MKCPKCNYIGFEPTDRCRNCGYDFSLSAAASAAPPDPDLPMRAASEPMGPLGDFDLGDARRPPRVTPETRAARRRQDASLDPGLLPAAVTPADLPLFGDLPPDDAPLVRPAAAVPPLSVRRSTPAPTRSRSPINPRTADREVETALPLDAAMLVAPDREAPARRAVHPAAGDIAPLGPRIRAAAIDWLMLLGLDLAVVYFTLRVSRLAASEILVLPLAPLLGFLLLLNGGYLALFTAANGQTIGKMACGLKVVSGSEAPLSVGRAVLRVVAFLVGAAAAGLGLLPAAFDGARRGLHDRLADTRVVRTS
jgi:uncharacterized RDD family membrane protein YckC